MKCIKTIAAVAVLSVAMATTASAQTADQSYGGAPYGRSPQTFSRSYDLPPGSYPPRNNEEYRNLQNFGFSGRDPSRAGGDAPNLKPSGS